MSFILDALKKSEQERPKGAVPDLHTEHEPPARSKRRRRLWPWLLFLALTVNAGLLLWGQFPRERSAPTSASAQIPEESPPRPAAAAPLPARRVEPVSRVSPPAAAPRNDADASPSHRVAAAPSAPAERPAGEVFAAPSEDLPREEPPRPKKGERIPEKGELPADIRRELPEIDISLHFYTAAPASRLVRINGRNLREGQSVSDGLSVERITASGVVLNFRGHRFRTGEF